MSRGPRYAPARERDPREGIPEGGLNAVNSLHESRVNHHLDARSDIVRRAAASAAGVLVRDLVRLHVLAGRQQAVARASLSRTLRRLWRAGLVGLHDSRHDLSAKQQEARERLARFEADPQSSYQGYRAWAIGIGMADVYGSAEAFLAAKRAQANAMPNLRIVRVTATTRGRASVSGENRPEQAMGAL